MNTTTTTTNVNTNIVNTTTANATKRQLWALYCITKRDYRGDGLTKEQASKLIDKFNKEKKTSYTPKKKGNDLEKEFLDYMGEKMQSVIATCREQLNIKSVLEDEPSIHTDPTKRKRYAFFGVGCGISHVYFDKRSHVGKKIEELSQKHRNTTLLKVFLKGFTKEEIRYMESVGFPLSAMYFQNIEINSHYFSWVASFMEMKGVKNVRVQTWVD